VTSHVSHPYKSTDITQALNVLILVHFRSDLDGQTLIARGMPFLKESTETNRVAASDASFINDVSLAAALVFTLAFAFVYRSLDTRLISLAAAFLRHCMQDSL